MSETETQSLTQKPKKKWKIKLPFLDKLKGKKFTEYVIAGVLGLVVIVIFLSSCSSTKKTTKTQTPTASITTENSIFAYSEELAHKLENVLGNMRGCSNVKVMVVAESSPSIVLAEQVEEKTTASGENKTISRYPVYVENGSSKTPMILYQTAPKVKGVLVVAKGAGDPNIKLQLLSAIQALLGIEASKIEILEGQ